VVGLGVGATPGAAALHPGGRIHLIELIPGVVGAAPWFQEVSYRVLERPNVDLEINDGRNHLLVTGQKYDIIQADPIQPMNAGANNLYSADFYRLARASLNEGGMMVQWVNNQLPDYAYRMMLRTFLDVFPNATLWHNGSIMVGTKDPIQVDPAALARKFEAPEVRASLASLGITSPGDVMQEFSAGPEQIRAFAGTGPILTDRTPFVEFFWTLPSNTPNQRPAEWNTSPLR
jgi:spermidine synthase